MDLFDFTENELKTWLAESGEKPFRAAQIFNWIYQKGVTSWEAMSDLNLPLRNRLQEHFSLKPLKLVRELHSEDKETTKYLWELSDGQLVESVLIRAPERMTVCVSSQVGCNARCAFCASGKKGLMRNLTTAEIIAQVYEINRLHPITHVVFMGMGEPLDNYEAVMKTISLLTSPQGMGLSQRRITVSTVGVVEGIYRLAEEPFKVNLVLSLHAPNQEMRRKIIPYARKYDLQDILCAMIAYSKATKRDITYEYTLMAGINDAIAHAQELAALVKGHPCTINLIPYNPVQGLKLKRPDKERIEAFREVLVEARIPTTWRFTKGKDIAAACGQLALQQNKLQTI